MENTEVNDYQPKFQKIKRSEKKSLFQAYSSAQIRCCRLTADARLPIEVHSGSSSYKLYADSEQVVQPNQSTTISTGLREIISH